MKKSERIFDGKNKLADESKCESGSRNDEVSEIGGRAISEVIEREIRRRRVRNDHRR